MTEMIDLMTPPPMIDHLFGVTIGVVTSNQDPEKLGRVKVKFPWLSDHEESTWARVVSPMAGAQRGFYGLPEVNDEVLVAFEHGQMTFPYILGALWNGQDHPPATNDDGKNNQRLWRSRSHHEILLDDTEGAEKIVVRDGSGKNTIEIDTQRNAIHVQSEQSLVIKTNGTLTIASDGGDVVIKGNNISLQAAQNLELNAKASGRLQAQTGLAVKCLAGVKINDDALEVT